MHHLLPFCVLAMIAAAEPPPDAAPGNHRHEAPTADTTADEAAAFFAALAGRWACTGAFADGRPLEADLRFEPALDGRTLRYHHVDRPPSTFAHEATWALDVPTGHLVSLAFAAMGDGPAAPALFVAEEWEETSATLVADTLRTPPWAPNRFTYTVQGDGALRMDWEVARGGEWRISDAVLRGVPGGNQWLVDAIRIAVGTGLRRGELCALRWDSVDMSRRLLRVQNTDDFQTKSGRERAIPLAGEALTILRRLSDERVDETNAHVLSGAEGGPLNPDYFTKRVYKYRELAKLPKQLNVHSLRHTFASWFVQRGGDLYRLKELMGHSDVKVTVKYAQLRPEALREEMELCFGEGAGTGLTEVERLRAQVRELEARNRELERALQKAQQPASVGASAGVVL